MGVNVSIVLGEDINNSEVSASGFDLIPIPLPAARDFGFPNIQIRGSDDAIWTAINRKFGRFPDWWFCTEMPSGPPWNQRTNKWHDPDDDDAPYPGGFYADLGWEDRLPRLQKKAVGARIVGLESKPAILATQKMRNQSRFAHGERFSLDIGNDVQEGWSRTTTHGWSVTAGLSVKYTTGGEVTASKLEVEASVEVGYSGSIANEQNGAESKHVAASLETGFADDAPDNAAIIGMIQGTRSDIKVAIDYECSLVGDSCVWYEQRVRDGRKAWAYPLDELLKDLGRPNVLRITETVNMGLVLEGESVLRDALYVDGKYILVDKSGQPTGEEV